MWCKNNGCSHYDSVHNKCKMEICWMETEEYTMGFRETGTIEENIMNNDYLTREIELYNSKNLLTIDIEEVRKIINVFEKQGNTGAISYLILDYLKQLVTTNGKAIEKLLKDLKNNIGSHEKQITYCVLEIYDLIKDKNTEFKNVIVKVLKHEPLTPLTNEPDQWNKISENLYQHKRSSKVFKEIFNNGLEIPYYTDDRLFSEDGGLTFFTTSSVYGKREIQFPFSIPEQEIVYIYKENDNGCIYYLTNPNTICKLRNITIMKNVEVYKNLNK